MAPRLLGIDLPPEREFGLDLLRALAIIQVMLGHGVYDLVKVVPVAWATLPLLNGGVSLFFVLSGFLIGRILMREFHTRPPDLHGLQRFWIRRWFRTLPAYYLVLGGLTLHALLGGAPAPAELWRYYVFVQNFMTGHPPFFAEAWSLAVEEWFYLCLPLAFALTVLLGVPARRAWPVLIAVVLLASPLIRYQYYESIERLNIISWDLVIRRNVVTRMDSLALGLLGAWLSRHHAILWRRARWPALLLGCGLFIGYRWVAQDPGALLRSHPVYYSVFSFNVLGVAGLMTLPAMSQWRGGSGRFYRWVTLTSLISYSLYLLHYSVVRLVLLESLFAALPPMTVALRHGLIYVSYWVVSFTLALLLYRFFEQPTTRLRTRFS